MRLRAYYIPNCDLLLSPQLYSSPVVVIARENSSPHATATIGLFFRESTDLATSALAAGATELFADAVRALEVERYCCCTTEESVPSCPLRLFPHDTTPAERVTATEW